VAAIDLVALIAHHAHLLAVVLGDGRAVFANDLEHIGDQRPLVVL
jgi:hypothetical protein